MGLTSFKGSHPTLSDVTVAKNYLSETELRYLNNLVSGYFDFAENQALMRKPMTMRCSTKERMRSCHGRTSLSIRQNNADNTMNKGI